MENYIDKIKKGEEEYAFRDTTSGYATSGEVEEALEAKQDVLEAGAHITIENNVISADGGGGEVVQEPGQSTTAVMSQKAVTDFVGDLESLLQTI